MVQTSGGSKKYALVTGAGTGLGAATAKLLAMNGYTVFGTIIPSQSKEDLLKVNVTPIVLDIATADSVKQGYDLISKKVGNDGLAALVNVAGLAAIAGGVIEGVKEERTRALFDVNVFGTLRMVQVFLPLLRKYGPAKIVNVSSSGTRTPVPFSGIYAISKFAVMGITNSLRYELCPFGIQVTSIEPGSMRTPMTADHEKANAETWAQMPQYVQDLYQEKIKASIEVMKKGLVNARPPEEVAAVILKALKAKKMRIRYIAGNDVRMVPFFQRLLGEDAFESMLQKTLQLLPPKQ